MKGLIAALLLFLSVPTFAAPLEPLGYLGILLMYTKDEVKKPIILGFAHSKDDCLEKGRKFVDQNVEEATAEGIVLSVACVPIPPPPSPPPTPKQSLGPITNL